MEGKEEVSVELDRHNAQTATGLLAGDGREWDAQFKPNTRQWLQMVDVGPLWT